MSVSTEFYLRQVAICDKSAQDSPLANERDKYLRAMAAWQALADREIKLKAARDQRDAEKVDTLLSSETVVGF